MYVLVWRESKLNILNKSVFSRIAELLPNVYSIYARISQSSIFD